MRTRWGALWAACAGGLAVVAGCGTDAGSRDALLDAGAADAAHRGDTGPIGGPVHDADVVCPSIGTLFDPFDEIDGARWSEFRDPPTSACSIAAADGRLALASADATVACGLASASCFDLTDRAIMIDAVAPGDDGVPEPFLRLALARGSTLEMRVVAGPPLSLELLRDGEPVASEAFDPEQHRLWRIMHTVVAGRIDFQTAPIDTTDWITLASTDVGTEETTEVEVLVGVSNTGAPGDVVGFDVLVGVDF